MNLDKILILGPPRSDEDKDAALEKLKLETEKLYFDHIFPHFQWNDLLRFRRVCKDTKELADKYIKTKGEKMCPEMTIYERWSNKDKCLARFLELGFPATRIYIMNTSGSTMFERESHNFAKFTSEQSGPGPRITQVRIRFLNCWPAGSERKFFEGLPNLKCLLVDEFGGKEQSANQNISGLSGNNLVGERWPERFKQLRKVKIGVTPNKMTENAIVVSRTLMTHCSDELEYSADAYSSLIRVFKPSIIPGMTFNNVRKSIEERGEKNPTKPNLKFYDFDCYNKCPVVQDKLVEFISAPKFLELLITCVKHSVKLLNVNSAWLQKWQHDPNIGNLATFCFVQPRDPNTLSTPVVSMINLHSSVISMTMPNLEQLNILATSNCYLTQTCVHERKQWPALKFLDVTVDSKMLGHTVLNHYESLDKTVCMEGEATALLAQFLFVGIQRPAVTQVSLAFVEGVEVEDVTLRAATGLGVCCPNVKKLSLVNWPGTNATLIKILGDIKALGDLCLDNCTKIGDLAFIRTDTLNGLVQQHPGLKKLALKQLDKMPKLTDKLFQGVVSQMKLSHLLLSSNKPLTNITPNGITALKNGEFAKSIEKFPFKGWSLANVSRDTFEKMEKEFRSYDMI